MTDEKTLRTIAISSHEAIAKKAKESGLHIKTLIFTSGKIKDQSVLRALKKGDVEKLSLLHKNLNLGFVYVTNMSKLLIPLGRTVKTLEVTISSSENDDKILLHKLLSLQRSF